jgi:hypothetical protein
MYIATKLDIALGFCCLLALASAIAMEVGSSGGIFREVHAGHVSCACNNNNNRPYYSSWLEESIMCMWSWSCVCFYLDLLDFGLWASCLGLAPAACGNGNIETA